MTAVYFNPAVDTLKLRQQARFQGTRRNTSCTTTSKLSTRLPGQDQGSALTQRTGILGYRRPTSSAVPANTPRETYRLFEFDRRTGLGDTSQTNCSPPGTFVEAKTRTIASLEIVVEFAAMFKNISSLKDPTRQLQKSESSYNLKVPQSQSKSLRTT
jgi:hypothetical protein